MAGDMSDLSVRAKKITAALNLAGKGIEYGPLHRKILCRPQYDILYVDYADREELVKNHLQNENVDTSLIPEIDIVTGGRLIDDFVSRSSIDYAIASHVMEHVPDILGWIQSNILILKPGGRLAVAFPDKRYCFDLKRKSSTISDVMAAYLEKRNRPSFQQICDHFWNVSRATPIDCWSKLTTPENAAYVHERKSVVNLLKALNTESYVDCHCWVFSDFEFMDVINKLKEYSSANFEIISFYPTQPNTLEFYVTLERVS